MQEFFSKLEILSKKAYCPYSNFAVSAILVDKNGQTWEGVNIENAVYPAGVCAERVAIFQAILAGKSKNDFQEIHIYSPNSKKFIVPCGQCLQVCVEFFPKNLKFFLYNSKSEFIKETLEKLLPLQFDKDFF
ncbi:cytidine deaminase [Mycoplasma sp. 'Moose RK']|uniref:cytidine deaminase n=1 Tax=Mycoplasma sp. 'Moose RK' TaxID=2780095 RepID=UPI0018C301C1|nr:cytidine deaminase [Mycoplasma sp. 'Moose RK']MBG0730940.1 cytidine deaminase [Mycoplasma sp. 'Moose RK']